VTELVGTKIGAPRRWRLIHPVRPWTVNAEAKMTPGALDEIVAEWRHAFAMLARVARLPRLELVTVTALPVLSATGSRRRPGAGACHGAVDAAIDGLVDAGVIAGPECVIALHLLEAAIGDQGRLVLTVTEAGDRS